MADNQKYYYMRLKEDFFDDDALKIIEAMPDGYLYSNILLKLYLISLKNNGKLMYRERIPYNPGALATLTRHNIGTVEKALQVFQDMDLIEVLDNGAIYMLDIQNLVGKSSTEADRKRAYRAEIEKEKRELLGQMSGQMSDEHSRENREKRLEIRDKSIESREKIDYSRIISAYNETCVSLPRIRSLSEARKKAIAARIHSGYTYEDIEETFKKAEASSFLKGKNKRNWSATFDWLIKDANMAKVLDGNYDDKKVEPNERQAEPDTQGAWSNKHGVVL